MMTVYFQIRPYIFNKGPYIFRKDRIFSTKDRIFSAEDRIFSVRTVYFQARTVYFPAGPYILLGPYIFKDRIFYFSGPYILPYNRFREYQNFCLIPWKFEFRNFRRILLLEHLRFERYRLIKYQHTHIFRNEIRFSFQI